MMKVNEEMKVLVFDMDGTIADLYGVQGWLQDLENCNPRPYMLAKPMYDMDTLYVILTVMKSLGWRIVVTSWLAKDSDESYKEVVRQAKRDWLMRYDFPYDEIHLVQYGRTKADCTRHLGGYQILNDDNEKVRNGWHLGDTINAEENIIEKLVDLLVGE